MFGEDFSAKQQFRNHCNRRGDTHFLKLSLWWVFFESGLLGIFQSFALYLLLEFLHVPYSYFSSFACEWSPSQGYENLPFRSKKIYIYLYGGPSLRPTAPGPSLPLTLLCPATPVLSPSDSAVSAALACLACFLKLEHFVSQFMKLVVLGLFFCLFGVLLPGLWGCSSGDPLCVVQTS